MKVKKVKLLLLCFPAVLFIVFFARPTTAEVNGLEVLYNLSGQLNDQEVKELTVTFSLDMVPLGGKRDGRKLLQISPRINGEFLWRGCKVLVFKPEKRFNYSTRYQVTVPAGIKALNGKKLEQTIKWTFTTPLAYPKTLESNNRHYYHLYSKEFMGSFPQTPGYNDLWRNNLWVTESIFIRFSQPVDKRHLAGFLTVTPVMTADSNSNSSQQWEPIDSPRPVLIKLTQPDPYKIKFVPSRPYERGTVYRVQISKGFPGTEGSQGTDNDYTFFFQTAKTFRYDGRGYPILTPEDREIHLDFTNLLKKGQERYFHIKKTRETLAGPQTSIISQFQRDGISHSTLYIKEPLNPGEKLQLHIDKGLTNIYGETLGKDIQLDFKICSSREVEARFQLDTPPPQLHVKSMKEVTVKMIHFTDDLLEHTYPHRDPGVLMEPGVQSYIRDTRERSFQFESDKKEVVSLSPGSSGFDYGFWGLMVERAQPFNICWDRNLLEYWENRTPQLDIFHQRDIDFVVRANRSQQLFWVYNRSDAASIAGAPVFFREKGKHRLLGITGSDGTLLLSGKNADILKNSFRCFVETRHPDNKKNNAFYPAEELAVRGDSSIEPIAHVFTDRDYYKPGETVHIAGVVKQVQNRAIVSPHPVKVSITIHGPGEKQVHATTVTGDSLGGFSTVFDIPEDINKGWHLITIRGNGHYSFYANRAITIDYFQPNTIDVSITGIKSYYLAGSTFQARIQGCYLSGNPMAGSTLITTFRLDSPSWLQEQRGMSNWKSNTDGYSLQLHPELLDRVNKEDLVARLDLRGCYDYYLPLKQYRGIRYLAGLHLDATAYTAEGKEFRQSADALYFPGSRITGIKMSYFNDLEKPINVDLAQWNHQGEPVSGTAALTLYKIVNHGSLEKVRQFERIDISKRRRFQFQLKKPGYYVLRCDTPDKQDRIVSTSINFNAWSSQWYSGSNEMWIKAEKKEYQPGETMKFIIASPQKGRGLVTIETGGFSKRFVIDLDKTTLFETPALAAYFPYARINAAAVFPGSTTKQCSTDIRVKSKEKQLRVTIQSPAELKPGSPARVRFTVKDAQKQGKKARLFVYCVDEGHLSISNYRQPDIYTYFYNGLAAAYERTAYRTSWSNTFGRWFYHHPMLDIHRGKKGVWGRVLRPDGTPIAGVDVQVLDSDEKPIHSTVTSPQGYYYFDVPREKSCRIHFTHPGYAKKEVPVDIWGLQAVNVIMLTHDEHRDYENYLQQQFNKFGFDFGVEGGVEGEIEGGVVSGVLGSPCTVDGVANLNEAQLAGIQVRSDFKPVLFFKQLETDEQGNGELEFTTSDMLTTYRIMALVYSEDCFGSASQQVLVSKQLLLEETMPEFVHVGDRFDAGTQVSNRSGKKKNITIQAHSKGILIEGSTARRLEVNKKANQQVLFPFAAPKAGEAEVTFYALTGEGKNRETDALLKKLPVLPNITSETLLDFDSGKEILKQIAFQDDVKSHKIKLTVVPSILKPARFITRKLIFYPYMCLEQRTSRALPYLVLTPEFREIMGLDIDDAQVRQTIETYIREMPEYMREEGGLAYYKTGSYTSDYLTTYVTWCLRLAARQGFVIPHRLLEKLTQYLEDRARDSSHRDCDETACFNAYVLSGYFNVSKDYKKEIERLYEKRRQLSLTGLSFLYRAAHQVFKDRDITGSLLQIFNSRLQVEADFAYFQDLEKPDRWGHSYMPFYSNRYVTALLLQAILEVEGNHVHAPRIVRWLLDVEPYHWNTTQTNFWIIYAMNEYARKVEGSGKKEAVLRVMGDVYGKTFTRYDDVLEVEKEIKTAPLQTDTETGTQSGTVPQQTPIDISVQSEKIVYLTTQVTMQLENAAAKSRGITVARNIYDESGKLVDTEFQQGRVYQVELLIDTDKEVPYVVIDAPLAAGFEVVRQDLATTRQLKEFNRDNYYLYNHPWVDIQNSAHRTVFYTYGLKGKSRLVYFVKAMYSGSFTWLPAKVEGMYHPQYFGRTGTRKVMIKK